MYQLRHFDIREFVPPHVWRVRRERAIELMDERILRVSDRLRDDLGPIVVNDWPWGGDYTESGLRLADDKHYRPYSQHSFGRACDWKPQRVSAKTMREHILANPERYPEITFIEGGTPNWVHGDCRGLREGHERIVVWTPSMYQGGG